MSDTISKLGAFHIGTAIALFLVAITTVALRFYCRKKQETRLFADDWLSLIAAILALALVVEACLWSTKAGFGYPLLSLKRIQVITFFHVSFAIYKKKLKPCIIQSLLTQRSRSYSRNE